MRSVVARVSGSGFHAGTRLRLYGPDSAGALDTSDFEPSGREPAAAAARLFPDGWLETAWLCGPWLGSGRWARWLATPWLGSAWLKTLRPIALRGESFEHGVQEHAVAAIDRQGNAGVTGATGTALVRSSPSRPKGAALTVATGVVTMTITEI